jgi:hypothetical protein
LERDRGAVCLVEAHVKGLIDFREANFEDPTWWRRLRAVLAAVNRGRNKEALTALYRFQCALVANSGLTTESFEKVQERALDLRDDIISVLEPWTGQDKEERKTKEFKNHRQRYIDAFGVDPADPEFRQWEAETIAKLQQEQQYVESDEERVSRLLRERAAGTQRK